MNAAETIDRGADMSPDGRYRYSLWRTWDPSVTALTFIMLNPSTADAEADDPTIRRCVGFARDSFGGIRVLNLYAFRATDPKVMFRAIDPVGPENDAHLRSLGAHETIVAAWGAHARPDRVRQVRRILEGRAVFSLGTTKHGSPRHPLYVRADQPLMPYGEVS